MSRATIASVPSVTVWVPLCPLRSVAVYPDGRLVCLICAIVSWDHRVTGRWWPPAPTGSPPQWLIAVIGRDFQPYGICVLTVSGAGIRRVSSFGDPRLVSVFGFRPDQS